MFCKHCGKRIADDSTFCQYCGGRQGMTATATPSPAADAFGGDDLADLNSFFSSAVQNKRDEEAKAAELAKRFEIRDGVLVKYHEPANPDDHIVVPDGVVKIGKSAFRFVQCTEITLPASVQVIQEEAFLHCHVQKINLPKDLYKIEAGAFFGSHLREMTIPARVAEIGNHVFFNCKSLARVELPRNLTSIGEGAFGYCSLTSLEIPAGVTSIGDKAFENCKSLTSVTLPSGLVSMGYGVFSESGITTLRLPEGLTEVTAGLCENCANLTAVELGRNTKRIARFAFLGCSSLTTVRCGSALTTIADCAFYLNDGTVAADLTLYLPSTLETVDNQAFMHRSYKRLYVEYEGSLSRWNNVKKPTYYWIDDANVTCSGTPKVGESYLFGSYTFNDTVKPIEWIVLSMGADRMLLLSKYVLDAAIYYHDQTPVTWERSDLRRWLNDTFLHTAFGFAEQNRILSTTVVNENNPKHRTKGGNSTCDKIFCLSVSEYQDLSYEHKIAKTTPYAKRRGVSSKSDRSDSEWWLRTPGEQDWGEGYGVESAKAVKILYEGYLWDEGSWVNGKAGVRPAMWVKK